MFVPALMVVAFCAEGPPASVPADSLSALYAGGVTWTDFLASANARRALWLENYEAGEPAADLIQRAREVGGTWRFLVVAVDSCSDSANTIPFLARLVEAVPGLDLRVVHPTAGRRLMEAHRTADGRAATPTVLLLDEAYVERGCFVERPRALRRLLAERASLGDADRFEAKMEWYREDRGSETVKELVELLEAAAAGTVICERGPQ
jgi:hypothetical protein